MIYKSEDLITLRRSQRLRRAGGDKKKYRKSTGLDVEKIRVCCESQ